MKLKFLLILLTVMITNTYAMSYDEIIESYNFSYKEKGLELNYINKSYRYPKLNLSLNFTLLYSDYEIITRLYSNDTNFEFFNFNRSISNNEEISLEYYLENLTNSNYTYQLAILDEYKIVFREYNLFEIIINTSNKSFIPKNISQYKSITDINFTLPKKKKSDITIKKVLVNESRLFIEIKNIGDEITGPFYSRVFDHNTNVIFEKLTDYLLINQTINFTIPINNISDSYLIHIDSEHYIDESNEINNIFFWPDDIIIKQETKKEILTSSSGSSKKKEIQNTIFLEEEIINETKTIIKQNNTQEILEIEKPIENKVIITKVENSTNNTSNLQNNFSINKNILYPILTTIGIIGTIYLISL